MNEVPRYQEGVEKDDEYHLAFTTGLGYVIVETENEVAVDWRLVVPGAR